MTLTDYLRERDMAAFRFAKAVGVAHTTINRILTGEALPRATTRRRIVAATGGAVSEEELLVGGLRAAAVRARRPAGAAA